eukprot:jgi/Tetstr1/427375/TSEL_017539.t1
MGRRPMPSRTLRRPDAMRSGEDLVEVVNVAEVERLVVVGNLAAEAVEALRQRRAARIIQRFARRCVLPHSAWLYLRELHIDVIRTKDSWDGRVKVTHQLQRGLEWWDEVPTGSNGRSIYKPVETVYMYIDSSGYGWGAVLNEATEARAASMVDILANLTSRFPLLMFDLRMPWFILDTNDISICVRYIKTIWADRLSREIDCDDWAFNLRHFNHLENMCNPRWDLIDDLVIKLHTSGAVAIVIVPYWPDRSWHERLSEMAFEVVVFPPCPGLFAPGRLGVRARWRRSSQFRELPDELPEGWKADHQRALQLLERTLALSRSVIQQRASLKTTEVEGQATSGSHSAGAAEGPTAGSGWVGLQDNPLYRDSSNGSSSSGSGTMFETMEIFAATAGARTISALQIASKRTFPLRGAGRAGPKAGSGDQPAAATRSLLVDSGAEEDTVTQAKAALRGLEDLTGFHVARDRDGLLVHYRHELGTQVHSIRFESEFDFPAEQLLALAREFDTVKSWNKFMSESTILSEISPAEVWVYAAVWLPFPFSQRDLVMHCTGVDLLEEEGCFVVLCHSPEDTDPVAAEAIPRGAASRERVRNLPGSCIKLVPLPPTKDGQLRCRAVMMVHNDPDMPNVPSFLVNFALNVLSPFVYHKTISVLKDAFCGDGKLAKVLQSRVKSRPELYGAIRRHYTHPPSRQTQWTDKPTMPSSNSSEDSTAGTQQERAVLPARFAVR